MTFKVKGGIQIGANVAFDSDSLIQQIELTPTIRPSLLLDFAKSRTMDSRATFTRASSATVIGQDGYIRTVGANVPRIEYSANGSGECEGLLCEYGTTNLLAYSENFANTTGWTPSNTVIIPNAGMTPAGTYTATKIVDTLDGSGTFHYVVSAGISIASSTQYSFSIFAKAGETTNVAVYPINGSNGASFNLSSGTVFFNDTGVTGSIRTFANGWHRCTVTITSNSAASAATPRVYLLKPGTNYTGTGNAGVFIWGAQFEQSGIPLSYVPSNTVFTSRASIATYQDNADGLIKTAAVDTIRYNYNRQTRVPTSILVEPAVTNMCTNSEDLTGWGNTNCTVTANVVVAPDGNTTADKMVEAAAAGSKQLFRSATGSFVVGTYYTVSVFAKSGERSQFQMDVSDAVFSSPDNAWFDLTTETVTYSGPSWATIEKYPNGWYRCSLTAKCVTATGGGMFMNMMSGGAVSYTGDGTSGMYFWGAQIEASTAPTSYIPTTATTASRSADVYSTATVTRAAETATIPRTSVNLKPFEGTLCVEAKLLNDLTTNQYIASLGDGTVNALNSIRVASSVVQHVIYNGGTAQGYTSSPTLSNNVTFKVAGGYSNTGWMTAYDGILTGPAGPGLNGLPPYGTITINGGFGSGIRSGYIKSVVYYPAKLSNTELISITSA